MNIEFEGFLKELAERTNIEDEYDLAIFEEALAEYKTGSCKSRPAEKLWKETADLDA